LANTRTYEFYKNILQEESMPLVFLDLELLDANIASILHRAGKHKIRVATKSIRCRFALEHILKSSSQFQGLMCYTAKEAAWLASQGFDNILLGYPCVNKPDLQAIIDQIKTGKTIIPMVDHADQVSLLDEMAKKNGVEIKVCIDIDMSTDFRRLHFGVYRSPLHTLDQVKTFVGSISSFSNVRINGVMGYEAQVAGVGDQVKGGTMKNSTIRILKKRSRKDYYKRRGEIVQWLQSQGYHLDLVNAGGTGSIEWSIEEPWITEVTVGSGFYSPGLFDHYKNFKHLPALGFVLQIVRIPKNGYFTCLGGGYIASGETGIMKQPYAYLPEGVEPLKNEGFGEVQTPIQYTGNIALKIGDPVMFRHAKAGELNEHFSYISVIKNGTIAEKVPTYRGEGKSFL
jgi:D-serine deaminase-like pyridoxal phosphate-dependent protein